MIRLRRPPSTRTRILGWYMLLLGFALVAALLLQRGFLRAQVSEEIDDALDQEVAELRQLAQTAHPVTAEPLLADPAELFEMFLRGNVALEGEAVVTLIDGELFRSDLAGAGLATSELISQLDALTEPVRDEFALGTSVFRYLAIPLLRESETVGTFVVAIDVSQRTERVEDAVRLGAAIYGSIFVVASVLAWVAAGGVLRPLRDLTHTARAITETDLSARIPVQTDDELAAVSATFNSMLDRLQAAFLTQKRFVEDAGHELRTPITVIRGHLEVMSDDPEDREQTFRVVHNELNRMARIVEDLLVLARSEQPDFIVPHPVDVAEFIQELAVNSQALGERPCVVEEVAHVVVDADAQRLTQAMTNLIRNALEHTPRGTYVGIGSRVEGRTLALWVRDRGPGISGADQKRIFDRFARGQAGKRTTGGAGLGLAITRAIAEGHRGSVRLHSAPSIGTTFTIVIPVAESAVPSRPEPVDA